MATKVALSAGPKAPTMELSKKKRRQMRKTVNALEVRVRKVDNQTILMSVDDLLAEVQDARAVIDVATEAWGEENEQTASSCVGVLDLLHYKLGMIEREANGIQGLAGAKGEKAS
jgi:hypothetical protein